MNTSDVKRLALILAKQAEIEGMKANNAICESRGEIMEFDIQHFDEKSAELENLAFAGDEELNISSALTGQKNGGIG